MSTQKAPRFMAGMSLTWKLTAVISFVFICFFIIIGYITEGILGNQIIINMEEAVSVLVKDEGKDIDVHFKRLEALGGKSANMVKKWLKYRPDPPDKSSFDKKYKQINGALRTNVDAFFDEDISAAFLSTRTKINDEIRQIIAATEEQFDNYARGVIPPMFNMWLITRHQMVRTYEKDWALTVEADHDFTKDIFYYIADPAHNPEARVKWTKPYYDSIWKHWMTSVVAPIYIHNRFLGVLGHDVILDEVYAKILKQTYFESGYGFIFDHGKNIVIHPKHLDRLIKSAEMGTLLSTADIGDPELSKVVADIIDNSTPDQRLNIDRFLVQGKVHYLFAYKLDFLDWYFAIVASEAQILKMLPQYRRDFIKGAIGACLFLLLIVIAIIWFSVIKPINTLTKAANEIRMGDLEKSVDIRSHDEIGVLSKAFNEMTGKLKTQMGELKTAEEKYRTIFENSVEGIFQTTPEGRIISMNPSMASILGYDNPDDLMQSINDIGSQLYVDPARRKDLMRRFKVSNTVVNFEAKLYKKNGNTLWVSLNARAARDSKGELSYIEGFVSDITEQKQAQEAILKLNKELDQRVIDRTAQLAQAKETAEKARKKAEVASLAKSEFLANMSHELRTPLNAILGYSQLMQQDSDLEAEQQDYLNIINRSGEHLLTLINDVLEISKIEAKRTTLSPTAFDLHSMLSDVYGMFKLKANEKHLAFDFDESDDLPRYVIADASKFRQILINLLGNAVKFTDMGGIAVRAQVKDKTEETVCIEVEVEDTGPGISEEELEKVFLAFEQTQSGQKMQGSTGLGMAISLEYARLMGGDIAVTSRVGEGSNFCFHCIVHTATAADLTAEALQKQVVGLVSGQEVPRILVAEDKLESRLLLVKYLEQAGFDVHAAKDGKEAVELFEQWAPHFIWMDIRMPVMNGLEATRRIRSLPRGDTVRIAALTASALEEERELILSAGCDEFVRKPYRVSTIFRIMEKHLELEYLYKENAALKAAEGQLDPCSVKLDTLPKELYKALAQAVLELDTDRTLALVEEISANAPDTGAVLKQLAENLEYDRLLALLEHNPS